MSKNRNEIIIKKMIKYAQDSTKYLSNMSYEDFISDERTLVFSIFNLSQLGELVANIDKALRNKYSNIPWNDIKGIRNRVVHDYDGVQYRIIWNILTKNIQPLIEKLDAILKDLQQE